MFAMRCTRKLLDLIPGCVEKPAPSTTILGDWYANICPDHPDVILLVSERALLPVAILAAPLSGILIRFVEQLAFVLDDLNVPRDQIMTELAEMRECHIGNNVNLRVTRLANDPMYHLDRLLNEPRPRSLQRISLLLADFPLKARGWRNAGEVCGALFGEAARAPRKD
jgi:hypothetical protein